MKAAHGTELGPSFMDSQVERRNAMKRLVALSVCALSVMPLVAHAGPITTITGLSPRYNSDVLEIRWASALTGGCNTSDSAVTNGTAANANELTAFLLTAFSAGHNVEVIFGGGCDGGSNWIQTVRLVQ
jgi:hypothetical protein